MLIVHSHGGVLVRLTEERWRHIVRHHPEIEGEQARVLETLAEPDLIQQGDFDVLLAIRLYPETRLTRKFLAVAYREVGPDDGFVLTAYLTGRPSARRKTLWKR